jgi:hypothetical protein
MYYLFQYISLYTITHDVPLRMTVLSIYLLKIHFYIYFQVHGVVFFLFKNPKLYNHIVSVS